jgi:hypothetical protein
MTQDKQVRSQADGTERGPEQGDGRERLSPEQRRRQDEAALETILELRLSRLRTIRSRAERWIASLSAVVLLLAAVTLIKGPEQFTDLPNGVGGTILQMAMATGAALMIGLVAAYSAAFGGLVARSPLDRLMERPGGAEGAAQRLDDALESETASARRSMRTAMIATLIGTFLLALTVVVAWAEVESEPDSLVCARIDGKTVVFAGRPEVAGGSLTLTGC